MSDLQLSLGDKKQYLCQYISSPGLKDSDRREILSVLLMYGKRNYLVECSEGLIVDLDALEESERVIVNSMYTLLKNKLEG